MSNYICSVVFGDIKVVISEEIFNSNVFDRKMTKDGCTFLVSKPGCHRRIRIFSNCHKGHGEGRPSFFTKKKNKNLSVVIC